MSVISIEALLSLTEIPAFESLLRRHNDRR